MSNSKDRFDTAMRALAGAFVDLTDDERRALEDAPRLAGALSVFAQTDASFAYAHGDETIRVAGVVLPMGAEQAVRSVGWQRTEEPDGEWWTA